MSSVRSVIDEVNGLSDFDGQRDVRSHSEPAFIGDTVVMDHLLYKFEIFGVVRCVEQDTRRFRQPPSLPPGQVVLRGSRW